MLSFMSNAQTGDDVFGEDPTVNALEKKLADMFFMEAGLFCPSGTMTNQIAIKCHTVPGNEVICEALSHIFIYEAGGIAFNSLCQAKTIRGNRGQITATQVLEAVNPPDIHKPPTALVSLENTANRGGGSCYDFREILQIKKVCEDHKLPLHLDGARLFNALIARNETPGQYGQTFDSISICLSKGLGAPVGSVLLGKADFIQKARRVRKILGGGMRQAGYLAAAGLFALENNVSRLAEDHLHARQIAEALKTKDFVSKVETPETNILLFEVDPKWTAPGIVSAFHENGFAMLAVSPTQIRMVTHLDISAGDVEKTIDFIKTMRP